MNESLIRITNLTKSYKKYIVIETDYYEKAKIVLDDVGLDGQYTRIKDNKIKLLNTNVMSY